MPLEASHRTVLDAPELRLAAILRPATPRSLRCVPDVDDNHFLAVDAVVHATGRSRDPKCIKLAPVGSSAAVRIVLEGPYS
jgi:hypothetical protein